MFRALSYGDLKIMYTYHRAQSVLSFSLEVFRLKIQNLLKRFCRAMSFRIDNRKKGKTSHSMHNERAMIRAFNFHRKIQTKRTNELSRRENERVRHN